MATNIDLKKINFRNPPKVVQYVVVILPVVIIIALAVVLVIFPKKKEMDKLNKDISQKEKKISEKEVMAASLEKLKKENIRLKEKLKELEERLPEEDEISSLLKQITDKTQEAGLQIQTWTPGLRRNHPSTIIYEVPVTITLSGSYHRLGMFFSSLTKLERIVNITGISLAGAKTEADEVILNVNFTAITFTAVPEKRIK